MPRSPSLRAVVAGLALVALAGGCSHDDKGGGGSTSSTATSVLPSANDAGLRATQVQAADLGAGFVEDT